MIRNISGCQLTVVSIIQANTTYPGGSVVFAYIHIVNLTDYFNKTLHGLSKVGVTTK